MVCTKDKYVGAIEKHRDRILEIHWLHQEKNPVLLFDVTEGKIYAYPYKRLKKELNTGGQVSLTKQYEEALRRDQFVLFIRDSQKKKLMSYSLGRASVEQSYSFKSNDELNESMAAAIAAHRPGSGTWQRHRIRRPGGGPKFIEQKDPTIVTTLEQMLKDEVAGDPMTEQKWIRSSLSRLSTRLADEGHQASSSTVARLLKKMGFSLKANKRKQGMSGCPDCDIFHQARPPCLRLCAGNPAQPSTCCMPTTGRRSLSSLSVVRVSLGSVASRTCGIHRLGSHRGNVGHGQCACKC
jgi:Rhodopirellula transposase DDE domain